MLELLRLLTKNELKSHRLAAASLHSREQCQQRRKVWRGGKNKVGFGWQPVPCACSACFEMFLAAAVFGVLPLLFL